ncbi:MAG: hypothetical protein IPM01_00370 [Burkholderiaceae bacterium]|nr:hypothetical protein [Burkholderiaceae bacterium]
MRASDSKTAAPESSGVPPPTRPVLPPCQDHGLAGARSDVPRPRRLPGSDPSALAGVAIAPIDQGTAAAAGEPDVHG